MLIKPTRKGGVRVCSTVYDYLRRDATTMGQFSLYDMTAFAEKVVIRAQRRTSRQAASRSNSDDSSTSSSSSEDSGSDLDTLDDDATLGTLQTSVRQHSICLQSRPS